MAARKVSAAARVSSTRACWPWALRDWSKSVICLNVVICLFSLRSSEVVGTEILAAAVKGASGQGQKEAGQEVANLTNEASWPRKEKLKRGFRWYRARV